MKENRYLEIWGCSLTRHNTNCALWKCGLTCAPKANNWNGALGRMCFNNAPLSNCLDYSQPHNSGIGSANVQSPSQWANLLSLVIVLVWFLTIKILFQ